MVNLNWVSCIQIFTVCLFFRFDTDRCDFFTQSVRSRIIEFILKRKRLSNDVNDDFAFGIDRALNEGVYTAAYPLHDVSITC